MHTDIVTRRLPSAICRCSASRAAAVALAVKCTVATIEPPAWAGVILATSLRSTTELSQACMME